MLPIESADCDAIHLNNSAGSGCVCDLRGGDARRKNYFERDDGIVAPNFAQPKSATRLRHGEGVRRNPLTLDVASSRAKIINAFVPFANITLYTYAVLGA